MSADVFSDLFDSAPRVGGAEGADLFGAAAEVVRPASPTVYAVGPYGRAQGGELARRAAADRASAWADRDDAAAIAADAWAVAYEPQLEEVEGDLDAAAAARAEWWRAVAGAPDTERMRSASVLRGEVAEVAARALAGAWYAYQQQQAQQQQGHGQGQGDDGDGEGESPADRGARQAALARAVQQAAREAADRAEVARAAGDAIGAGTELPAAELREVVARALRDPRLAAIAAEAGRAARALRSRRAAVVRRVEGRGGVELVGADGIGRLVPAEAAALSGLCGQAQRLLALSRLADRRALAWAPDRRRERARRGPVVVVVDESGSMSDGGRIVAGKGLAIAVAAQARADGRAVLLVGFGAASECRPLLLRPHDRAGRALADWACAQYGGGTAADVPLIRVPRLIDEAHDLRGASDVIVLTDGELSVPPAMAEGWRRWAARDGARLLVVGVGVRSAGGFGPVADRVVLVDDPRDPRIVDSAAGALWGE